MKILKNLFIVLLCSTLCISFIGCGEQETDGSLKIVVTAFPHYDFARQLTSGIDNVEITMLISPGTEVHTYEPTPKDILAINSCDLFIYTGGESEKWAEDIIKEANINVLSFMEICEKVEADRDDHEHEHEHEHEYDEHVWTSPKNAIDICKEICKALCDISPVGRDLFEANFDSYSEKLVTLDKSFEAVMQDKKRDYIVIGDRFPFLHLACAYGFDYHAAFSGCSSATEPSAKTISALSDLVKSEDIPYIFVIEFSNEKIADNIIDGTNTQKLLFHSCHNLSKEEFDGGVTYIDLMTQNCDNLRKAMCE